ncbi:unnamed protein product, partial [Meganyctiphanes norvegica]
MAGRGVGGSGGGYEVPQGLQELLIEFTVSVLVERPTDLLHYAHDYFRRMHEERNKAPPLPLTTTASDDEDSVISDDDDEPMPGCPILSFRFLDHVPDQATYSEEKEEGRKIITFRKEGSGDSEVILYVFILRNYAISDDSEVTLFVFVGRELDGCLVVANEVEAQNYYIIDRRMFSYYIINRRKEGRTVVQYQVPYLELVYQHIKLPGTPTISFQGPCASVKLVLRRYNIPDGSIHGFCDKYKCYMFHKVP